MNFDGVGGGGRVGTVSEVVCACSTLDMSRDEALGRLGTYVQQDCEGMGGLPGPTCVSFRRSR